MAEIALRYRAPRNAGLIVALDDEDLPSISPIAWYAHRAPRSLTIYAKAMIGGRWVFMHQIVAGIRRGFEIDHVDGNGLNNRRANLRHLTHADNIRAGVERQKQAILDAQEPELQAWLALHMAR